MSGKSRVILTIGHFEILLPEGVDGSAVIKTLSKGVQVFFHSYYPDPRGRGYTQAVELLDEKTGPLELGMKVVPANAKYIRKKDDEPRQKPIFGKPGPADEFEVVEVLAKPVKKAAEKKKPLVLLDAPVREARALRDRDTLFLEGGL